MPIQSAGIDHWIGNFGYISYFDTFEGFHPRAFTPKQTAPREFSPMEEIGNCLLAMPKPSRTSRPVAKPARSSF